MKQCGRNEIKLFPDPKDLSSSGAEHVFKEAQSRLNGLKSLVSLSQFRCL